MLRRSMHFATQDDTTLLRVLPSQRYNLIAINDRFINTYDKSLKYRMEKEVSGKYAKVSSRGAVLNSDY